MTGIDYLIFAIGLSALVFVSVSLLVPDRQRHG